MANWAMFIGNLTKDPKMREAGDKDVCGFRIAVNKKGKRDEDPLWVNVSVWGKAADACDKYLRKGSKVMVAGPISLRTWKGDDGERTDLEIDAREVEFLTPKGDGDEGGRGRDRDDRPREGDKSRSRQRYEEETRGRGRDRGDDGRRRGRESDPDDSIPF